MPLPAALLAQAARLGIPKAATYTYKQLQKLITNTLKKETKKKKVSGKGFRGQGSKRKQKDITKRKKNIPSGLSIK